jgi:putative ATP-dependent endonuclease of the OLD family
MNLSKITIINFRNFENTEIEFSSGFQTIIGENNIGKSNLYWAIRLVLDKELSYNNRILEEKDFFGFKSKLSNEDYIIISIELFGEDLASFPAFHAMQVNDSNARITYVFAHKSIFKPDEPIVEPINIEQFRWQLFAGGNSLEIEKILKCTSISFRDLDGINLFYISAFRNINTELQGSNKSLLSSYCLSRKDSESELSSIKAILENSSRDLNQLEFIPKIEEEIVKKNNEIAGSYFSFPIAIGFISTFDTDSWNQLSIYYKANEGINVPVNVLGLGQKNLLYLGLFIAGLVNKANNDEINILLVEEPEAHLHPQLQKILFSRITEMKSTQVFLTSHSTHIASDCNYKNLNILFKNMEGKVKAFAPFNNDLLNLKENKLLKRYLDATRSEMFFASALVLVEGIAEQFIIPKIAESIYNVSLVENNISIIPIHSRYFEPYLKILQDGSLEIPAVAIIDGDIDELEGDEEITPFVEIAKKYEIPGRVIVSPGTHTLETDLFPSSSINNAYLEKVFDELGHSKSYLNLMELDKKDSSKWNENLISRIDSTVLKGRFAQELAIHIDDKFIVPTYISKALTHIFTSRRILYKNVE